MNKSNDIIKDFTVFILYTIALMIKADTEDNVFADYICEMSVLKQMSENIQSELNAKVRCDKCHVVVRIFYELLKKNEDLRLLYNEISELMFDKIDDKSSITNYNTLHGMITSIGVYQIMDNLVNTV